MRSRPSRSAVSIAIAGVAVLFGLVSLAVSSDSSWKTFWPDAIIGLFGAAVVGLILTRMQDRADLSRTLAEYRVGWASARPKLRPLVIGRNVRAEGVYTKMFDYYTHVADARELVETADLYPIKRWAAALHDPELMQLDLLIDAWHELKVVAEDLDRMTRAQVQDTVSDPAVRSASLLSAPSIALGYHDGIVFSYFLSDVPGIPDGSVILSAAVTNLRQQLKLDWLGDRQRNYIAISIRIRDSWERLVTSLGVRT